MQERILATEEYWPEHNQHLILDSLKPEFTAFLAALTALAMNIPRVPTLELLEPGPSTAAPSLHVEQCSQPHTHPQTCSSTEFGPAIIMLAIWWS